jgi:hypothetical protein
VKRLLVAVLIAVTGAGIAFGATQAFYSAPDESSDGTEPLGLVDEFADLSRPELSPSPSPTPDAEPASRSSGGSTAAAPAPTAEPEQDGPRTPRSASRVEDPPGETPFPLDQPGAGDVCGDMEDLDDRERCREEEKEAEDEQERQEDKEDDAEDNNG